MKKIIIPFLALLPWCAGAQDLSEKIPHDATVVVSVRGNAIQELISIDEFNRSYLGSKVLKEISGNHKGVRFNSLEDFGLNLNATGYYFLQQTDSISYHCFLLPLVDKRKFENLFTEEDRGHIESQGALNKLYNSNSHSLIQWSDDMALIVTGNLNNSFLEQDPAMQDRYGMKQINYSDYYYDTTDEVAAGAYEQQMADTTYAVEAVADMPYDVDRAYAVAVEHTEEEPAYEVMDAPPPPPKAMTDSEEEWPVVEEATPVEYAADRYYNNEEYEEAYNEQSRKKDQLISAWTRAYASAAYNRSAKDKSILSNASYLVAQDPKAVATLYVSSFSNIVSGIMPYYYRYKFLGGTLNGFGALDAQLFVDEKEISVKSSMQLDEERAEQLRKIYKHKLNRKFVKYINADKMVGFFSYSLDTKAYLDVMPEMMEQVYGSYISGYRDEIGLTSELFSLLLDEEAVAKVIKGDALFVLTDIGPKEYSYTTYDYDDDYERKEVTKTKTETLPDFLLMVSSDDTRLLEKLMKYGIKKEVLAQKNGIYSLVKKTRNLPFDLHLLVKDGIVFLGTSYRDIQQINEGTYKGNISKEQKNLMLKNNAAFYFNPRMLLGKIPESEMGSKTTKQLNTLLAKTDVMYASSGRVKNNRSSGEMVARVPEGQVNGLKYFFSLIGVFSE